MPRGDKFLRHEVHPVVEGADDAEVRELIQGDQAPQLQCVLPITDRSVGRSAPMPGVDVRNPRVDLDLQFRVALQPRSRRHTNLHEQQARGELRCFGQEPIDRFQPLGNAFRVVQPIDADTDDWRNQVKLTAETIALDEQARVARGIADAVEVDADRHRNYVRFTSGEVHEAVFRFDAELFAHGGEKVAPIPFDLEGDEVVGEEALHDLAAPWAHAEAIRVGPRDVPEDRCARRRLQLSQLAGHEREVIVLDEDRRVGVRQFGGHGFCEAAIHLLVGVPILRTEDWLHVHHVAQRPETFVREAAVVARFFLVGEPDPVKVVGGGIRRNADAIGFVGDGAICITRTVRDPRAATLAHQRVERHRHPAGGRHGLYRSVPGCLMEVGLAIGNDYEHAQRESKVVASRAVTTVATLSIAKSISASVVERPSPNRTDATVPCDVAPIAWRTWEGAWLPELHAEPVETARSPSAISRASPSMPSKLTCRLCGRRWSGEPLTRTADTRAHRPSSRRSRNARSRAASPVISTRQISAARPSPTIPGTFSVPDRRPFSWPPPRSCGGSTRRGFIFRMYRAPHPLGP